MDERFDKLVEIINKSDQIAEDNQDHNQVDRDHRFRSSTLMSITL